MVDTARALLDELMGRNRDLDPSTAKVKKVNWDDPEFCQYYLVKFCPHDLFVNTRADLGLCPKLHDDEAKRMYETARPGVRKRQYEDDFLRFCNNMINEVDRKIQKGRQRLLLMNKGEGATTPVYISKFQEQLNTLNARIKKLLNEAEEAGHRGDVDQAQGLTTLCEQLKEEKEALIKQHDNGTNPPPPTGNNAAGVPSWATDLSSAQEKQMEVCEVCGAFLIVGDAQQRIEDHLTGKQHLGYSKLRKAVDELHEKRQKEREEEEKRREDERKARTENGFDRRRERDTRDRDRDRERDRERERRSRTELDRKARSFSRDRDRRERDKHRSDRDKDRRNSDDRRSGSGRDRSEQVRERERDRDRHSHNRRDDRSKDSRRRSRSRSRSRR